MDHPSNSAVVVGVDNTHRRRFNLEDYAERARQRQRQEEERARKHLKSRGPPVQRKPLKSRDYQVHLESRLGQTRLLNPAASLSQQAGYFCSDCNCIVKDSANFLDHINGKKHQRALGMSMKAERASLQQVQSRFEKLKKQKTNGERLLGEQNLEVRDNVVAEVVEEERSEEEPELVMDAEVQAVMGFGGFSSSNR